MNNRPNTLPSACNADVYARGFLVMITHSIPAAHMEAWVQHVADLSEQAVDWHFAGGRICVLALGDLPRVRQAIQELLPEHNELQREFVEALLPGRLFQPSCTLYGENEWNPAHEYVRQLNVERE